MRIADWLLLASSSLTAVGIASGRLDCLLLLEDITGHDRAWLLAHDDQTLSGAQLDQLADQLERRLQHEPLAYIRGYCEFYGRSFAVTPEVLVPRPESESMITLLLRLRPTPASVADIGTGSGCLAVTVALQTSAIVSAVDIDGACLALARRNAVMHTAQVTFLQGDLLTPYTDGAFNAPEVFLANLPYVPQQYPINDAARHEPPSALFAGADGLDAYRRLFGQFSQLNALPTLIITEALLSQHEALSALALSNGYRLDVSDGLAQAFVPARR